VLVLPLGVLAFAFAGILVAVWQLGVLVAAPQLILRARGRVIAVWWLVTLLACGAAQFAPEYVTPAAAIMPLWSNATVGLIAVRLVAPLVTAASTVLWLAGWRWRASGSEGPEVPSLVATVRRAALIGTAVGVVLAGVLTIAYFRLGDEGHEGLGILWAIVGMPLSNAVLTLHRHITGVEPPASSSVLLFWSLPVNYALFGLVAGYVVALARQKWSRPGDNG
jgi:hypothetical protein